MRLTNLLRTLTPSFFSSKKTDVSKVTNVTNVTNVRNAATPQAKTNAASARHARSMSTAQKDEDTQARLSFAHTAERTRAEAARGRFQQRLLARLPEVPTQLPTAAQRAEISRQKWLEQHLPAVPTHTPARPTSTKTPIVSRPSSQNQVTSKRVITKADMHKLIAYKKRERDKCVQYKQKLRIEIDLLSDAIKSADTKQLSTKVLLLQEKWRGFNEISKSEKIVLAKIHAFEKKLRTI